jgi:hypothetical protein
VQRYHWALLLFGLMSAGGCNRDRKEPPECLQSRQAARELLREGQLEQAELKLEVARDTCGQSSQWEIERLSGTALLQRRNRAEQQAQREKEEALDREQPLRAFLRWARAVVDADKASLGQAVCGERGSAEEGFCTLEVHSAQDRVFKLRYLAGSPSAFRLEYTAPVSISCLDLGRHRERAKWVSGSVTWTLCEPTEHGLTGMAALFRSEADSGVIFLFAERYPEQDPAFRALLRPRP